MWLDGVVAQGVSVDAPHNLARGIARHYYARRFRVYVSEAEPLDDCVAEDANKTQSATNAAGTRWQRAAAHCTQALGAAGATACRPQRDACVKSDAQCEAEGGVKGGDCRWGRRHYI